MTRISRCIAMLGVACLLAFGSVGDSQVPGDGTGPWYLRDQVDIAVLRSVVSLRSPQWMDALQTQSVLGDLRFRPLISTSLSRVYQGSIEVRRLGLNLSSAGPGSGAAGSSSVSLRSGVQSFGYVHVLGSGCALPPDQLFVGRSLKSQRKSSQAGGGIGTALQLEFLLFTLEGLAGQGSCAELIDLGNWFETQTNLAIVDYEFVQSGTTNQLDFLFRDTTTRSPKTLIKSVHAVLSPAGSFDQVVVK